MTALFDKLGIHFQYPESWTLETEQEDGGDEVTVYSPGGAFWSLAIHGPADDPLALAAVVVEAMREEYDNLDCEDVAEIVAGQDLVGFDLNFYCLDLTNTAQVRVFAREERTFLLICQAEDRELAKLSPVFRAITTSLIQHRA